MLRRMTNERLGRRRFLEVSIVTAGSLLPVVGCGSDEALGAPPEETVELSPEHFPQSVASGDPTPTTVILWTRVVDPTRPGEDLELELEVARGLTLEDRITLGDAPLLQLVARADADHTVRVRVEGLEPGTEYQYRFRYRSGSRLLGSPTGRTKTAPAEDSDATVSFAVVGCQDYVGKYYHLYELVSIRRPDFVLHLGDYIYETLREPTADGARQLQFDHADEALELGDTRAARSLDNYRDLYRKYRSDPALQAVHEGAPMIAIWDDHEFSNDAHGATGTYTDGRQNELDLERRANADRAWFEYMPVDYERSAARALDASASFPDNFRIYRDFRFGKHLHLIVADQRRYRSDHVVPEDAFPGAIFLTQPELAALLGTAPEDTVPFIDVETYADGAYAAALRDHASALELRPERLTGRLSAPWINALLAALTEASVQLELPPIDLEDPNLGRGYAYHQLMKSAEFSMVGSRYLLRQAPFEALALHRYRETEGASEDAFGAAQRAWFYDTIKQSTATWKVWGSQFTVSPRVLDLTQVPLAPAELQDRFYLSGEDWDGLPNRRRELLEQLSSVDNVVIVTGDLHALFAGTPHLPGEPERSVAEFVVGSISSSTWSAEINGVLRSELGDDPALLLLAQNLGPLLTAPGANPHLAFQNLVDNGYADVSVGPDRLTVHLNQLSPSDVQKPPSELEGVLQERVTSTRFYLEAGSRALRRTREERMQRWDVRQQAWVEV